MFKRISVAALLSFVLVFASAGPATVQASNGGSSHSGFKVITNIQSQWQDFNVKQFEQELQTWFKDVEKGWKEFEAKKQQQEQNQQQPNQQQDGQSNSEQNNNQPEGQDASQSDQTQAPTADENNNDSQPDDSNDQLNDFEQKVVELTNQEREKQGLSPLKIDTQLSEVAREKSRDMAQNGYFSHTSPTYGSPFDMMDQYGVDYRTAGENIAKGQRSPEQVVNAWMNSEGHRKNIMNDSFTHIGVGYIEDGNVWTQQFIGK
ncbi:CAP domain-containing protein [Thalassobacillus sp. CUG 92003]|uniref:CAP domain-containing protein n=1 Tax=Thalassobacillus sp. CUG 92003 TaxID=2736641 RepID=UPI0015E7BC02|nr:CAP domain-containing protein [Thalassobacillus sp. CUG 92003]